MKKLLFLLLAAATVTACDNDDENFNPDSGSYTCTLKVTDTAGDVTNQTSGVICNLTEQPDKSVALTMKNVKFTDNPREPVKSIVFPKLSRHNDDGSTIFESTGAIIPEIDDAPYEDYVISNFACEVTDNAEKFHLVFTCTNPTYHLNHTAEFNGTLIK